MNERQTSFGNIKLLSLRKFFDTIPAKNVPDGEDLYHFCTLTQNYSFGSIGLAALPEEPGEEDSLYERAATFMLKGERITILSASLIHQIKVAHLWNDTFKNLIEDMVVKHSMEMGDTKYLVKIAPRTWMPANPYDFAIIRNNKGISLAVYGRVRSVAYRISKLTEKQATDYVKKVVPGLLDRK